MNDVERVLCGRTRWALVNADVRDGLAEIPSETIQTVVTSPPYWRLRDYGTEGQLGLEPSIDEHVSALVKVFREVRRVLRPDGTVWLNYGDRFNSTPGNGRGEGAGIGGAKPHRSSLAPSGPGLPRRKSLLGLPWRLALALIADDWILRGDVIWQKPTCLPESCTDRPTLDYEHLFLLVRNDRYLYHAAAIAEPVTGNAHARVPASRKVPASGTGPKTAPDHSTGTRANASFHRSVVDLRTTRNRRSVWPIVADRHRDEHRAHFPRALVRRCVLAGSSPGDLVLDPFSGSGTTVVEATALGRLAIGVELSARYHAIAQRRIAVDAPLIRQLEETEKALGPGWRQEEGA